MVDKQLKGAYAPDSSKYSTLVDGDGNLVSITTAVSVTAKIKEEEKVKEDAAE